MCRAGRECTATDDYAATAKARVKLGERIWIWRYSAEDRRRLAAARQHYLAEVAWCLLLVALGAGRFG